jgi:hypothetical protein
MLSTLPNHHQGLPVALERKDFYNILPDFSALTTSPSQIVAAQSILFRKQPHDLWYMHVGPAFQVNYTDVTLVHISNSFDYWTPYLL